MTRGTNAQGELMAIVTIGYRTYACSMAHAAKILTSMATLREVELRPDARGWLLTGGTMDAVEVHSGRVSAKPTPPSPSPAIRTRATAAKRLQHAPMLALTYDPIGRGQAVTVSPDIAMRRALKAGQALIATGTGPDRLWSLSDGREIEPKVASTLLALSFLGGRLRPSDDGLPGLGASQSWRWTANTPVRRRGRAQTQAGAATEAM